MEQVCRLYAIVVPHNLHSQLSSILRELENIKPKALTLDRSRQVIETFNTLASKRIKITSIRAKCQLMIQSHTQVNEVIFSNDDEMLCDIIQQEAQPDLASQLSSSFER
ncbi:uncharacterized protein LOC131947718 [Physella acuta]|uniref:uncharacterized protein LOC131947718 n=1 Tax=Physella acuta TaxID=109671 RepID=UPI0027DC67B4|nr:uncharacterized protein LOC131947718 [Physella acuta]